MTSLAISCSASSTVPALPDGGYFNRDRLSVLKELPDCLYWDVAEPVANYVTSNVDIFDAKAWERSWRGAGVPELETTAELYEFWFGPDPCDGTKKVYETHLPPVYRPEVVFVTDPLTAEKRTEPFDLDKLGSFVQHPQNGAHPSRYYYNDTEALNQHRKTPAGRACWLVPRKDGVLFRGKSSKEQIDLMKKLNAETGAGYETELSIIDVATCAFAYNALWGTRYLGDNTGMEGCNTYCRCSKDQVKYGKDTYPAVVGDMEPVAIDAVRGAASGGLGVSHISSFGVEGHGVWGLRKFYGH